MHCVTTSFRLALVALVLAAAPSEAAAYVCTPVNNNQGQPVIPPVSQAWVNRCIPYFINRNNALLAGEARRQVIRDAFDVWERVEGSDIRFIDVGYTDQTVGFNARSNDNQNVVTAVENPQDLDIFTSPNQIAITVTFFSIETGEIFDSDIAINAVGFRLDEVTSQSECLRDFVTHDLPSILAHEVGHVIGFDHPPETESTMYMEAPPCEIKKRDLTPNDIQGVVDVYPSGLPVSTCDPPPTPYDALGGVDQFRDQCTKKLEGDGSSCQTTHSDPSDAAALAALFLAGLLALRFKYRRGMLPSA